MMRVRQLCGGGFDRDLPYWIKTIWCGVQLATARRWLARCGWGSQAPLRLRLKGRCWIEESTEPAVARPDEERFAGVLQPIVREVPLVYCTTRRRRRRSA